MLESKITSKSQTTLPAGVRDALGVGPGDRLGYIIEGDSARVFRVENEEQDPALDGFLDLLEADIQAHPERLHVVPKELVDRLQGLTAGADVDLDEPIRGPVSL
jgi:antitoxin PrlF